MIWWILIGMAVITFLNRYVFLIESFPYTPGPKVKRFLSYSVYAVLTAIWAPIVFSIEPKVGVSHAGLDYLLGASLAGILSFMRVPSIMVVMISSTVFFGLRFLAG